MTERNLGYSDNVFIGQVVNVFDPDKEGKLQINIIGKTDNISNSECYWGKTTQDITNASQNKIGCTPVGAVVGTWVTGYWLDSDQQIPVITGTVAKAGDASPDGETVNGQLKLVDGTNSTPIGGRIKTNSFVTRQGLSIAVDDRFGPVEEQNDSDGVDITAQAKANTSYANNGTTGSILKPSGSVLSQISTVDPKNKNAVLPNSLDAFQKMKDINAFSCISGVNQILGQVLGIAIDALGTLETLETLGLNLTLSGLSATSVAVLQGALGGLINSTVPYFSEVVQAVVDPIIPQLVNDLSYLIDTVSLTNETFNMLMNTYQSLIQNNGALSVIGANIDNIMSMVSTVLPQISDAINAVQNLHIPESVLDLAVMTQVLQNFAMNQAFLKTPDKGKKALAKLATSVSLINEAAEDIQDFVLLSSTALNNLNEIRKAVF